MNACSVRSASASVATTTVSIEATSAISAPLPPVPK
jgi:hypothetical protein